MFQVIFKASLPYTIKALWTPYNRTYYIHCFLFPQLPGTST